MDKQRGTALHEAGHAIVGEVLGIRIEYASARRDGDANGWVKVAGSRPEKLEMAVVLAAGYAARRLFDPDHHGEGHRGDFDEIAALAGRLADTEPDLWDKAHARAYQLVREPRIAYAIEYLADELVNRAAKGFGMGAAAIGAGIAQAFDEFDASQRIYGMRAPSPHRLEGCTPSEEAARREARLREIGALRPAKRRATKKPATKRRAPRRVPPGFDSPNGFIAAEDFGAVIGGRRTIVRAGQRLPNGHPIVVKHMGKFRAATSRRKVVKVPCPEFA